MLNGTPSADRRALLKLAMHVVFQQVSSKDKEMSDILYHLHNLDLISEFQRTVNEVRPHFMDFSLSKIVALLLLANSSPVSAGYSRPSRSSFSQTASAGVRLQLLLLVSRAGPHLF